jgi:hypothetical protein
MIRLRSRTYILDSEIKRLSMIKANAGSAGGSKTTQTVQVVYSIFTAIINSRNNIHKQYLPNVKLYRITSSGRVLCAESGRNDV